MAAAAAMVVVSKIMEKRPGGGGGGNQSIDAFKNVKIPTVEEMRYNITPTEMDELLKHPVNLTTEDLQVADTALNKIKISPEIIQKQQDVLGRFDEVSREGLLAQEKADLSKLRTDELTRERGQRDAILQGAQERGVGGSGLEFAAQLAAQQQQAQTGAQRGMDIAALSKQRALEAMSKGASLAGDIRSQEFQEKGQAAQALDTIAKFNAQQEAATRRQNQELQQSAAIQRQQLAQQDAARQTEQNKQDSDIKKYLVGAEMEKARGVAGGYSDEANRAARERSDRRAQQSSLLSSGLAAAADYYSKSDKNSKTDIQPITKPDVTSFLENLTGYKYRYKDPGGDGKGPQSGVMAQDLEKSKMGEGAVTDTYHGKMVNTGKVILPLLASVSNIHERLKVIEEKNRGKTNGR